jgi:hypothetical protein
VGFSLRKAKTVGVSLALGVVLTSPGYCVLVSSESLSFTYQQGGNVPTPVNVAIQSVTASFTVSIATNPTGWLTVSPTQGSGTTVLLVSLTPQALSAGSYIGLITITDGSTGAFNTATVQVYLTVKPGQTGGPQPSSGPDGRIAHIADGSSWRTLVTVVNLLNSPQRITIHFWSDSGQPLALPVVGVGRFAEIYWDLPAYGEGLLQTTGESNGVATGWANITSSSGLSNSFGATAVFQSHVDGRQDSEATSPMQGYPAQDFLIPFDNRDGFATGVAVANFGSNPSSLTLTFRDGFGRVFLTDLFSLGVGNHASFSMADRYPATAGYDGTLEIKSNSLSPDGIAALGLRFNPSGSFTSVLPIPK